MVRTQRLRWGTMGPTDFGSLLRRRRLAAGLTQEELAERAGLSGRGVQDLERGIRRRPQPGTIRRLADGLRLDDGTRAELLAVGQRETVGPGITRHGSPAPPLPVPLTSFIGRGQELAELAELLTSVRLLTLTGVGGCGKTRLALEVARANAGRYSGGVWLVELGPISDATLVDQHVSGTLGIRERPDRPLSSALSELLRGRPALLVLDNCEHLVHACANLLGPLLPACPELHVLATSREPIGISGEVAWRVPSLPVPSAAHSSVEDLQSAPSVQLFVERARLAYPGYKLTAANASAVALICRRLDGIPLALELAAARLQALTAEQIAARLDQRFRLLTGGSRIGLPRQQTLQATLDWSHALLDTSERRLLERLSVFAGRWTLEAAEVVGAGRGVAQADVMDLLSRLVSKSIVTAHEAVDGAERYGLLETMREYAREKLQARGATEISAVRDRHARFYASIAEQLFSPDTVRQVWNTGAPAPEGYRGQLEEIAENVRLAAQWLSEMDRATEGLRLVATLAEYCLWLGRIVEARSWLEPMVGSADGQPIWATETESSASSVDRALRVRSLYTLGIVTAWCGEYAAASSILAVVEQQARGTAGASDANAARAVRGLTLSLAGNEGEGAAVLHECLRRSREEHDHHATVLALRHLGHLARWHGEYERAEAFLRESVAEARQAGGGGHLTASSLSALGRVLSQQGKNDDARACFAEVFVLLKQSWLRG